MPPRKKQRKRPVPVTKRTEGGRNDDTMGHDDNESKQSNQSLAGSQVDKQTPPHPSQQATDNNREIQQPKVHRIESVTGHQADMQEPLDVSHRDQQAAASSEIDAQDKKVCQAFATVCNKIMNLSRTNWQNFIQDLKCFRMHLQSLLNNTSPSKNTKACQNMAEMLNSQGSGPGWQNITPVELNNSCKKAKICQTLRHALSQIKHTKKQLKNERSV